MSQQNNNHNDDDLIEDIPVDSEERDGYLYPTESTSVGVGGRTIMVNNQAFPYFGIMTAAIVLFIASENEPWKSPNKAYGMVVGGISLLIGCIGVYMALYRLTVLNSPIVPEIRFVTYGTCLSWTSFIWTTIGAAILTFEGPFVFTGNGYFAAWGLVIGSICAMGLTMETIRAYSGSIGWSYVLLVVSAIQLGAILPILNSAEATFAFVLCILTIMLISGFGYFASLVGQYAPYIFTIWSILWLISACLLTFQGPFYETGNGYFSAWGGFLVCIKVAASTGTTPVSLPQHDQQL